MWDVGSYKTSERHAESQASASWQWSEAQETDWKLPNHMRHARKSRKQKINTPETPCKIPPLRFYLMRFCAVLFLEWMSSRSLLDVVHTNIIIFADCDYEVVFLSTQPGSEILQLNINCSCAVSIQYTGSIHPRVLCWWQLQLHDLAFMPA